MPDAVDAVPHQRRRGQHRDGMIRPIALEERALEGDHVVAQLLVQVPYEPDLRQIELPHTMAALAELYDPLPLQERLEEAQVGEVGRGRQRPDRAGVLTRPR